MVSPPISQIKEIKQEYLECALFFFFFKDLFRGLWRRWIGVQIFYQSPDYQSVNVNGLQWRKFISTMQWTGLCTVSTRFMDTEWKHSTFLLQKELIAEQTQRNLFQPKEEETVKRWERGNGKPAFLWVREEMTDTTTPWNHHAGALICSR